MLLVTPPRMYINLVRCLSWSATRVEPWVRTWTTFCLAVVVAGVFGRLERLRVCENAVEGAKRTRAIKVKVMRFKVCFSSAAVLRSTAVFCRRGDCTKD